MLTQQDINAIKAQRFANTHDPLALMENTQTPFYPDHSSLITYIQHPQPNNNFVQQPSFNTNYMQQPMQNPKDISDPITALDMALELMSKAFQLNNITPTNNNQKSSSNPCYNQIAQSGMNIDQDRHMLMVDDNVGNQFRENAVQNVGHLVRQNVVQNQGTQNVGNQNRLSVVPGIANQHGNGNVVAARAEGNSNGINGNPIRCIAQNEEAGIQLQAEEFDLMAAIADLDEIEEVNANCILMANLQQAPTSVSNVEQGWGTVEQHPANVEETQADESLAKHKALEWEFERLLRAIAQLGDLKGKSKDTPCVSNTPDPLPQKLENKNVELEFQNKLHDTIYENAKIRAQLFDKDSEQKDTTKGTSTNTKFANQSTERISFLQSLRNKCVVRQSNAFQFERPNFSKTRVPQKVDKTNDLSNPVTSNSVPTTREPKVVENDKVIALGMFRINPLKNSREVKSVPNKPIKASVRTYSITVPQPHVITKKVANSDSNGFSSTGVDFTTKTRRPQPTSNTKNDRVPSASKSSRIKNKEVEVEDHPRNLPLSKNKKHKSSECNNIKLAIRNDKSKIVCAMWSKERLASPKPSKPRMRLRWSPTGKMFDIKGKLNASSESNGYPNMFVGLRHNLFSVGQFCDSDLEVTFRRNTCFVRNLEGVDLLKGNRTTNLNTINLHDMASASPICLMARATSTKSCKEKAKGHLTHPNQFQNSKQRLHLLHMDLCGPMRIASINGKWYVLVIVDDYSCYTWIVFLRSKDEAPEEIKTFLKKITVLLQAPVIIVEFQRISLTGFRSCTSHSHYRSVSKQTTRYPCEASHGHKIENQFRKSVGSHKSPTKSLFDVGSSRISIFTVNTSRMFWQNHKDNA
ncbi:retrovirus-related pol polyprotein from transposon TNT 1-94 [Tanacetum coccineum]